jgi:transcriptional regulator with XRE-family HTH domain
VEGDLQRTVGRNLRAYREARGLSQEAFADVLGVHRTYMGAIERGERNLTLKSVERIVSRLDLDPLVLLTKSTETEDRKPLDRPLRDSKPRG